MNSKNAAASLRQLGDAIGSGQGIYEAFECRLLAVENGAVMGCCALGAAYLKIHPATMAVKNLPDDFSDTGTESHDTIINELAGAFPVLAMTCFSGSFLGHLEHGELDDDIEHIALGPLDQAISAMFDDTSASFSGIKVALHKSCG